LIDQFDAGNQADFARRIDRTPAVVWQYLSGHREMGEKLARHIERRLRLPAGWMDDSGKASADYIDGEVVRPALPPLGGGPDLSALMSRATPGSRSALERIAQAADAGRLSEADIDLLDQIARHIEGRKE
jgi:hypothetical protein